jgi:acyl carrier protein
MDLLTFLDQEFQVRLQAKDLTPENLATVETIVHRLVNRPAMREAS